MIAGAVSGDSMKTYEMFTKSMMTGPRASTAI